MLTGGIVRPPLSPNTVPGSHLDVVLSLNVHPPFGHAQHNLIRTRASTCARPASTRAQRAVPVHVHGPSGGDLVDGGGCNRVGGTSPLIHPFLPRLPNLPCTYLPLFTFGLLSPVDLRRNGDAFFPRRLDPARLPPRESAPYSRICRPARRTYVPRLTLNPTPLSDFVRRTLGSYRIPGERRTPRPCDRYPTVPLNERQSCRVRFRERASARR